MSIKDKLMEYDPQTGEGEPYPSHAQQYRTYHGVTAWLTNPFTGKERDARDIGSDPQFVAMKDDGCEKVIKPENDKIVSHISIITHYTAALNACFYELTKMSNIVDDSSGTGNMLFLDAVNKFKDRTMKGIAHTINMELSEIPQALKITNDRSLLQCPCCNSVDVGGAHDTVTCYGCELSIKRPVPLKNAIDAWNTRDGVKLL